MTASAAPLVVDDLGWPESPDQWRSDIRPAAMSRLAGIYGQTPTIEVAAQTVRVGDDYLPLLDARLIQTAVAITGPYGVWRYTVAAIVPARQTIRATLLGMNFRGNHTIAADQRLLLCEGADPRLGTLEYENAEFLPVAARGAVSRRWPLDWLIGAGYGVVTHCYLQCGPDSPGIFDVGPHQVLFGSRERSQTTWGAIGIWAWSLSRTLDLVLGGQLFDPPSGPVVVFGHSRMGKTALWAAAQDERFAACIANESGSMGAALSRAVGETPLVMAQVRPYWFTPGFSQRVKAGQPLDIDQDHLLAMIAPRPLLVGSADQDHPADPEGERLATERASAVWELYGATRQVHYHLREGEHDLTARDWQRYVRHLGSAQLA
jgi:hypothetical protein